MADCFAFDEFVLDVADRQLSKSGDTLDLNGRYFDALALLVGDCGRLVSKDRFMAEVWRGVPVTDEALTQCVRTLRRQLGDDAARPRFIETVPKHGYRFIAPVEVLGDTQQVARKRPRPDAWRAFMAIGASGTIGGALAGLIGGLLYGFAAASQTGIGAMSVVMVLLCVSTLVALIGAAGVSFAIASAAFARSPLWQWTTLAGAAGGLVTGAGAKLLGTDAFTLLVGHSPGRITGAMEGLLLGAAVGLGASLAARNVSIRKSSAVAGLIGATAGIVIVLLGGRLMLGSLAALSRDFPGSRLRLDPIVALFGEAGFGPVTQLVTGALEGALFAGCIVAAMGFARRRSGVRPL